MVTFSKAQIINAGIILLFMVFFTEIPKRLYYDHSLTNMLREGTLILVLTGISLLISKAIKYNKANRAR